MHKSFVFTSFVAASLFWNSDAKAAGYAVVLPDAHLRAHWAALRDLGTNRAHDYRSNRVAGGVQADEPEHLILAAAPGGRAEADERALGLSRNDRISIQRDLMLLGFSTGGVDGVFGPKTRAAIRRFQARHNYPQTGYLNAQQVAQIHREAAQRRIKPKPVVPIIPILPKPVQPKPVQPKPVQPQPVQPQPQPKPQPTQPQPTEPQPGQPQPGQPQPGQPQPLLPKLIQP